MAEAGDKMGIIAVNRLHDAERNVEDHGDTNYHVDQFAEDITEVYKDGQVTVARKKEQMSQN